MLYVLTILSNYYYLIANKCPFKSHNIEKISVQSDKNFNNLMLSHFQCIKKTYLYCFVVVGLHLFTRDNKKKKHYNNCFHCVFRKRFNRFWQKVAITTIYSLLLLCYVLLYLIKLGRYYLLCVLCYKYSIYLQPNCKRILVK